MRKFIIISCTIGSLTIILGHFGFFEALLMFLVAGAIPGTAYSVPSGIMYGFLITAISFIIIRFVGFAVLDFFYAITRRSASSKKKQQELPKRRYSQI